jgi:hypothetical protein
MVQATQEQAVSPDGRPIPPEQHERNSRNLRIIRLMFVELDEMSADSDEVSDAEWAGWSPWWSNGMYELIGLVQARDVGGLTLYQEVLLGDILALLERERSRLTALQLTSPTIPATTASR